MRGQHIHIRREHIRILRVTCRHPVHNLARILQPADARQHLGLHQFQLAPVAVQRNRAVKRVQRDRHLALLLGHQPQIIKNIRVLREQPGQLLQQIQPHRAIRQIRQRAEHLRHHLRPSVPLQQRRYMPQRLITASVGKQHTQQRQPRRFVLRERAEPGAGNLLRADKIPRIPGEAETIFQRVILAALHRHIGHCIQRRRVLAGMILKTRRHRAIQPLRRLRPLLLRALLRRHSCGLHAQRRQHTEQGKRQTITAWQPIHHRLKEKAR